MKKHKKIYMEFFGVCSEEPLLCERCYQSVAVDVHHCSPRGMGGDPKGQKDVIENLGGLCRQCHNVVEANPHDNRVFAEWCANLLSRKREMTKRLRR